MADSRFVGTPEEVKIPQCYWCRHFLGGTRCNAFDEIPEDILNNFFDHHNPYPGDRGIQFERRSPNA